MIGLVILITIGIIIFCAGIGVAAHQLYIAWMRAARKIRALQTGAPSCMIWPQHYQPLETHHAWRVPLEFEAQTVCPHCGNYETHNMSKPTIHDHADAATVRRCGMCGHIWGEK